MLNFLEHTQSVLLIATNMISTLIGLVLVTRAFGQYPTILSEQYKWDPSGQYKAIPIDQYKAVPIDQYKLNPIGQYKWDPSGQYRLVPDTWDKPVVVPWTPTFITTRTSFDLVEPWRKVVVDTLPVEIKDKNKEVVVKKVADEVVVKKTDDVMAGRDMMMMIMLEEEERCLNMGVCTVEIIERIKVKRPWMLETLCINKGLGCSGLNLLTRTMNNKPGKTMGMYKSLGDGLDATFAELAGY